MMRALAMMIAMAGAAQAEPVSLAAVDEVLLQLVDRHDDAQVMADAARRAAEDIRGLAGLAAVAADARVVPDMAIVTGGMPVIARDAVQLAMTQLAIDAGTNDMLTVVRAQRDGQAIYVNGGVATLAQIAAKDDGLVADGATYRLMRPLVVWADATLVIAPGERLVLDRAAGAFVLSFGGMSVSNATVAGDGAAPEGSPDFVPFVLIAGRGWIAAQGATFANLGIADTTLFSGLAVVTRGLMRPERAVHLLANTFRDVQQVLLQGTEKAVAQGNLIAGAVGGVVVAGGRDAVIAGNDLLAKGAAAGIRVTDEAASVVVADNLVLGAPQNGIVVDVAAHQTRVTGNAVMFGGAAGIVLRRSSCGRVSGNVLVRNGAAGLRTQGAGQAVIAGNAMLLNGGVGVEVMAQPAGQTVIADNVIAGNREGLKGAGIGALMLSANQLSSQLPRLFAGEFAQYQPAFLTAVEQQGLHDFRIGAAAAPSACGGN